MANISWKNVGTINTTTGRTYSVDIRKNGSAKGKIFLNQQVEVSNLRTYLNQLDGRGVIKSKTIDWDKVDEMT